jgi:uncharacterized RDD family membrane protein YckC
MSVRIRNLAFFISASGLIAELVALSPVPISNQQIGEGIRTILSSLGLSYFEIRLFDYYNFDSGLRLNFLNLTGYLLLLLGAIAYSKSKGKETRLIRAITAVILIGNLLAIIFRVTNIIRYSDQLQNTTTLWWALQGLWSLANLGWAYLVYGMLKWFQRDRVLGTEVFTEPYGAQVQQPQLASKLKRFTNWILDIFTCIFIFSPFARHFGFLGKIEDSMGEQAALIVFLAIARLIYYSFFENIFQATPAKMFTETRVVTPTGKKPTASGVLQRTLSRFIPFEPFSFFGEMGWHDSFSNTQVANEERTGVIGFRYLWIIAAMPVVAGVIYLMSELYDNYKSYRYQKGVHQEKIMGIQKQLAKLDSTSLIEVADVADSYSSDEIFLKVESVSEDTIMAVIIQRKEEYSNSLVSIEKLYNYYKQTGSLFEIPVLRADLENALTPDYSQSKTSERNARPLLGDQRMFEIKRIDRLFGPSIHDRGTGSYGYDLSMELCNYGWTAQIISLQTLEGTIEWVDELPKEAPTVRGSDYPSFYLRGSKYERGAKYKFKMVVKDSLDHTQTYLVEGRDLKKTIERID